MSLRHVLLALGSTGAIGYGGYYFVHSKAVSSVEKEVNDITRIVEADRKRIALTQASALSEQQKMEVLLQQAATTSQSLEELSTQIEALEQQRGTVRFEHQQLADRISTSADKIQEAIGEGARAKESLKMGERNLLNARKSVDSARLLLNPLNHPRIKSLVYGSKS